MSAMKRQFVAAAAAALLAGGAFAPIHHRDEPDSVLEPKSDKRKEKRKAQRKARKVSRLGVKR